MRRVPALLLATSIFAATASASAMAQPDAEDQDQAGAQSPEATPEEESVGAIEQEDSVAGPAPTAGAPPATDEGEPVIVVTGSRIARAGFDTVQPALVVDSDQIEVRAYTNIGQALSDLPAFGVPGNSPTGAQSSFGPAQTFVDFFGLGTQRTLTLVNGRRFVSSNTASIFGPVDAGSQVDLNVIPTKLIDRIETIAVGGAPIYGADAIAGTVNIILKRDFEGIELDAQYGISSRGDAEDYRIRGIAGTNFADGRGNIVISGEYNESGGLTGLDRRLTREGRFFSAPADPDSPFDRVLFFDQRLPSLSQFGIPFVEDFFALSPGQVDQAGFQPTVTDAQGRAVRFDQNGNLVPIEFGTPTGALTNFSGGNGFSIVPVTNLLATTERYLANALGSFEISDRVRVFGEAWYSNTTGVNLVDQPFYNTALFDAAGGPSGNFVVSVDNPFLTPDARASILRSIAARAAIVNADDDPDNDIDPNRDSFYLGRANTDLATGRAEGEVELYRFIFGFDGTFALGDRELSWELVGNYGRSEANGRIPEVVRQNLDNALNAVTDASGNIVCAPGAVNAPIETRSSTCAPLNLFGSGVASQAALDYISLTARPQSINEQKVFTASISGDAFELPGGPLGFALGYEHREEEAEFNPGEFYFGAPDADGDGQREQFGSSIPIDPISGKYDTDEFFGELRIPIVGPEMDVPFIRSLEIEGAARWVDNSLAGGDLTWTAGGRYEPVRGLTVRGNFTRAIRAPAITEAFNPTSQAFDTADDPCDQQFINAGPDPATRAANCAAAGITQPFQSNIVEFTSEISVSGNPDLQNETADSWTIGAVVRPAFIPAFTLAVDWIDIELQDAIVTLNAEQILEACYDAPDFPNDFCGRIDRDAAGQVDFVRTGYLNAASFEFQGLLAEAAYRIDTPFLGAGSTVSLGANYQYIDQLEQRAGLGDIDTFRSEVGYSEHQASGNITYNDEVFTAQLQAVYYGEATFDADEAPGTRNIDGLEDVVFLNTSLAIDIDDRLGLRLVVDNILDQDAPFPTPAATNSTLTYFPGILGRYYKVGATFRF